MSVVARFTAQAGGTWGVVHPFTGHVEFSTTDPWLAEAVRDEFDKRDPVTTKWLFEALYQIPPQIRCNVEWVMSEETSLRLRQLKDCSGAYLWMPPIVRSSYSFLTVNEARALADLPPFLLGKPVRVERAAVGISLRDTGRPRGYQTAAYGTCRPGRRTHPTSPARRADVGARRAPQQADAEGLRHKPAGSVETTRRGYSRRFYF